MGDEPYKGMKILYIKTKIPLGVEIISKLL